ncbi:MAG: hypothetical protein PHW36_00800 [Bacilli bacterium]|nr:hypothetical protein [Bacilli bacterium]
MISITIAVILGIIAGIGAIYSFVARGSWMYADIVGSFVSSIILWVLAVYASIGQIGDQQYVLQEQTSDVITENLTNVTYSYQLVDIPLTDPAVGYLLMFVALIMTAYMLMNIFFWLKSSSSGGYYESEGEEEE